MSTRRRYGRRRWSRRKHGYHRRRRSLRGGAGFFNRGIRDYTMTENASLSIWGVKVADKERLTRLTKLHKTTQEKKSRIEQEFGELDQAVRELKQKYQKDYNEEFKTKEEADNEKANANGNAPAAEQGQPPNGDQIDMNDIELQENDKNVFLPGNNNNNNNINNNNNMGNMAGTMALGAAGGVAGEYMANRAGEELREMQQGGPSEMMEEEKFMPPPPPPPMMENSTQGDFGNEFGPYSTPGRTENTPRSDSMMGGGVRQRRRRTYKRRRYYGGCGRRFA